MRKFISPLEQLHKIMSGFLFGIYNYQIDGWSVFEKNWRAKRLVFLVPIVMQLKE